MAQIPSWDAWAPSSQQPVLADSALDSIPAVHHGRDPLTTVIMRSGRQLHVPGPEVRLGGPPDSGQAIPAAGQHTTEVLAELGYRDEDIAALLADGVAETELA